MAQNQNVPAPLTSEEDFAWREREWRRLWDGTYKRLPYEWREATWFIWKDGAMDAAGTTSVPYNDHYAHLSLADGAKVAFTESPAKGAADRQTVMKPGKYLTKYFSHVLSADRITQIATEFSAMYATATLHIATDADDIERVYTNGPHSCMAHSAESFAGPCHPARVYAGPDLAVAYINNADSSRIVARAVCWPERKVYSTIYGDAIRLEAALEAAGYACGDLDGARVQKLCAGSRGYVMPSVDGIHHACVDGAHIVLGMRGNLECQNTNGVSGKAYSCCGCGEGLSEEECFPTNSDGSYCESCYDDCTMYCEYYEETREDETVEMANGQYWSLGAFRNHGFVCAINGTNHPDDEGVRMANGDTWSEKAFEDDGFVCEGTGVCYPMSECVRLHDGTFWSQDYFADHGEEYEGEFYAKGAACTRRN